MMRFRQWIALLIFPSIIVLSGCSHHSQHYLGYIEGKYIYLSSPVSGMLMQLNVRQGDTIQSKQVAFQLDPEPELAQLEQAKAQFNAAKSELDNLKSGERSTIIKRLEAQISQAKANLAYSKKMYDRNAELVKTGAVGKAIFDRSATEYQANQEKIKETEANLAEAKLGARSNLVAAQEARVNAMQSEIDRYQWLVNQKTIDIPEAGYVQDTLFKAHEFVPAGKPVIQFLPTENRVLVFYIPEKMLSQIQLGKTVYFTCDGCEKRLSATVNYISSQAEYTPPVIYSENARAKLVYYAEAKIDSAVAVKLHTGQPVDVTVENVRE